MKLVRCNPNRVFARTGNDFDSALDSFFNGSLFRPFENGMYVPRVDIIEEKDNLKLVAEIPGMDKAEIKVVVEDGVLIISGEKKSVVDEEKADFIRSELRRGSFSRSFTLPDYVDTDRIEADYENGILSVNLPKAENVKPKEIEVKVK